MNDLNHNLPPLPESIRKAIIVDGKAGKADANAERDLDKAIAKHNADAPECDRITVERLSAGYASKHGGIFAAWRLAIFCGYVESTTTPTIARAYRDAKGSLPKAKKALTTAQAAILSDRRQIWNGKFNGLISRLTTAERDAAVTAIQAKLENGEDLTEAENLQINPPLPSAVDATVKQVKSLQKIVQPEDGAEKYRNDFPEGGMLKIAMLVGQIETELGKLKPADESDDS
tara:strand:+ start:219 stop:911 length:693 start_codon:yes stop_codon:yes gene_type:complete